MQGAFRLVPPKKFQVSNYIVNPIKKVSEYIYWLALFERNELEKHPVYCAQLAHNGQNSANTDFRGAKML